METFTELFTPDQLEMLQAAYEATADLALSFLDYLTSLGTTHSIVVEDVVI